MGVDDAVLADLVDRSGSEIQGIRDAVGGRLAPRRRPRNGPAPALGWTVYLDECGSHSLSAKEPFGAFVLAATLIRNDNLAEVDRDFRDWKRVNLGDAAKNIHEPDVRKGKGPFNCGGDRARQDEIRRELASLLRRLDFVVIACVLDRGRYLRDFGTSPPDDSLPNHPYLMTLHFLMERVVMALDGHLGGGRAQVVAEARGPREDALLQYEYARLHLDGTAYVSAAWFRNQLTPGIEFVSKRDNVTGVQLADLAARPCGEKVLHPSSAPARWPEIRDKLCAGQETRNSILGLKVIPWDGALDGIWKS